MKLKYKDYSNTPTTRKTFGYRVGQFLGGVILLCLALCVSAVVVALTLKLLFWLF